MAKSRLMLPISLRLSAALLAAVFSVVPGTVHAEDALILPLASRSVLLDITIAGERLLAVGERGHILFSDDRGVTWKQARVPTRQMLTAVHFPSPARGWAVGHDGLILASIDAGENWVIQRDGLRDQVHINRERLRALEQHQGELKLQLLAAGSESERANLQIELEDLQLDLEDAQWTIEQPVHAPPLLDVFFSNDLRGVATGAFNTLLSTDDGGLTWTHAASRLDNPGEFHLNAVTGDEQGGLWIAAEGGLLFRSRDNGERWESLPSPYQASWFGIIRAPQSGALLAFGLRGTVFRSLDEGESWEAAASDYKRTLSGGVYLNDRYALLAGSVGGLLFSEDGGASFRARPLGSRINLSAVAAAGEQIIAVGQGGIHRAAGFGELP